MRPVAGIGTANTTEGGTVVLGLRGMHPEKRDPLIADPELWAAFEEDRRHYPYGGKLTDTITVINGVPVNLKAPHGTAEGYGNYGCRCDDCEAAA